MAMTAAQKARAMRQESLREYLSNQGLLSHVVDIADKIQTLQDNEGAEFELKKLKASAEIKLKLINKYLGDEKTVETIINDVRRSAEDYSDDELTRIIASAGSERTTEAESSEGTPPSVH